MSDQEISSILNAITGMRSEVMSKFEVVFDKIDGITRRVNILEGDRIARDAVSSEQREVAKEKLDWGKWAIRSMMVTLTGGMLILLWKILIGSMKIIEVIK